MPTAEQVKPEPKASQIQMLDALVSDDDELLIEEISIDGMCGVY